MLIRALMVFSGLSENEVWENISNGQQIAADAWRDSDDGWAFDVLLDVDAETYADDHPDAREGS